MHDRAGTRHGRIRRERLKCKNDEQGESEQRVPVTVMNSPSTASETALATGAWDSAG